TRVQKFQLRIRQMARAASFATTSMALGFASLKDSRSAWIFCLALFSSSRYLSKLLNGKIDDIDFSSLIAIGEERQGFITPLSNESCTHRIKTSPPRIHRGCDESESYSLGYARWETGGLFKL